LPGYGAITYTCDPNVDAAHAGACAYINSTIAPLYGNTFSNMTASIYVVMGATSLGQSSYFFNFVTYSQYLAALTTIAQTSGNPTQVAAVKSLNGVARTMYGNFQVVITNPQSRAFGLRDIAGSDASGNFCPSPGQAGCYDGIVTITRSAPLFYRTGTETFSQSDFYAVVEHETNEILGTSSCINTPRSGLTNPCQIPGIPNALAAVDLFRYQSAGTPVLISTAPGAYFSYDGGQTNGAGSHKKIYNTIANGQDYADFLSSSPCQLEQSIQDAVNCPGRDAGLDITNDGGAEINILNALGYTLSGPSISSIENGATLQTVKALAPGTYLAVFGANLSSDAQGRTWAGADFKGNADGTFNIPKLLDGTSVTVGGLDAYVYYVSGTQLNIVTPTTLAAGDNIPVVVTVNGQTGAPFSISLQNLAPSFFAWYPGTAENGKYLIAQHLNYANVGKAGLFPTQAASFTTPAAPGETIQLYGTGFGPTSPAIAPGIETDKVYNLSPVPTATVGGLPAGVVFAGLIPPLSQVYQVDVTIPKDAPNGDLALVVTVNGVQSFAGLITVLGN
jgi:uncharacterized protein (TIGR03437 family)